MHRYDLLTLELFIAVVEEQSIAAAGERAHIAASAISRRISELEAMLGTELFIRHSKGIELTEAGTVLLHHARTIRGSVSLMEAELRDFASGLRGLIRVAANKSAIMESLPMELAGFLALHPLIRIDLEEGISPSIVQLVASNGADIGIFGGNVPAPGLHIVPYRQDELIAVLPLGHPLADRSSIAFADLLAHDFVCLETGSSIETLCRRAASDLGGEVRIRVRVGSFEGQLRFIESGLGIGIVPRQVFDGQLRRVNLVALALEDPWRIRPLNIVVRDTATLSLPARRLVGYLERPSPNETASCPTGASPRGAPSLVSVPTPAPPKGGRRIERGAGRAAGRNRDGSQNAVREDMG
ncbi:HTH-type transcriptional regulator ArgP [Methylobacterium crusticola]|uniref:HTH-type transcriptional regulator ArgP n=1 Tax=Methylobacterium crusticola TaxID=1697972 RepID=A0ABQ4R856_9HYPH|nr:LysR family transcriptional regulator [Methylobacterium crusticola]GJD53345.1 HTH-type transcriptional regulator ArgP [Methylobacterium crusticola]